MVKGVCMNQRRYYQPSTTNQLAQQSQIQTLRRTDFFSHRELAELPNVLVPGEQVLAVISGMYTAGTAILCVTSRRLLLVDKKMIRLSLEDIRFESIREVHYSHQPFIASIKLYYAGREMQFRTWYKNELRIFSQLVQQKMFEVRDKKEEKYSPQVDISTEVKNDSATLPAFIQNTPEQVDVLTAQLQPLSSAVPEAAPENTFLKYKKTSSVYIDEQLRKLQAARSFVDHLRMSTKAGRQVMRIETYVDLSVV
jgi:hypothetical protein